jgi:hypothetical protein
MALVDWRPGRETASEVARDAEEAPHGLLAAGETGRPSIAAFKSKAVIEARELNGRAFDAANYFGCGPSYLAVSEIFDHGLKRLTADMNGTGKGMIE